MSVFSLNVLIFLSNAYAQDVQEISEVMEILAGEPVPSADSEVKINLTGPETSGIQKNMGNPGSYTIFDDRMLLRGYAKKYADYSKDILIEMIQDDNLSPYKMAAAVRVFNQKQSAELVYREKKYAEKVLLRRLNRASSPFVQVEIMYALCKMDRYRYFQSMVPALIQKLNHYNSAVNEIAYESLDDIIKSSQPRSREARIVFLTLRKILFLSKKRLTNITEPEPKLARKLKLLRWSIKILGTQELKKLPNEVINLL